jgi:hypothetical protein
VGVSLRRTTNRRLSMTMHGKVHGRTIALHEDLGLPDGQVVELRITSVRPKENWCDGRRRCAGALADDPGGDAIMEEIYRARKLERRRQLPDFEEP